jgi:activator of 2-hydroxyglutaryl-CoA dehydratase
MMTERRDLVVEDQVTIIGKELEELPAVKGLYKSVAGRISTLARRVGLTKEIVIAGGVAKNGGL